jgi:hypothetical protein
MNQDCLFVDHVCSQCGRRLPLGLPDDTRRVCQASQGRTPATKVSISLSGVGTELSKLLAKVGIKANEGCKCKARAEEMNRRGVAWCEKNIELIVDWLEEESTKRHLPFVRAAGKILVRRAIRSAKRQSKESLKHQDDPIHQLRGKFEMQPTDEAFTDG